MPTSSLVVRRFDSSSDKARGLGKIGFSNKDMIASASPVYARTVSKASKMHVLLVRGCQHAQQQQQMDTAVVENARQLRSQISASMH